jgi:hypothetical protein
VTVVPTHKSRRFCLAALGIIFLTIAIRLPSLVHPQPIDSEAMYSVVANEIVDGGRPYVDAVERKPPLLFWTYAAVFKVAGKFNWKALHLVAGVDKTQTAGFNPVSALAGGLRATIEFFRKSMPRIEKGPHL